MFLIGCDFHASWQQVCWLDRTTGEMEENKLVHAPGEVERFYRQFPAPARVGMESTGNCQWFVEMMTRTRTMDWRRGENSRQQKQGKRDAQLLLRLLAEERFPRIWTPSKSTTRSATVVDPPLQASAAPRAGEERVTASGFESGLTEKKAFVE
jgi:transposase